MNERRAGNAKSGRRQRKPGRRRARRALQAARQRLVYALAARWRKITAEHQKIYPYKKLEWITVEEALCIVDNPSTLEVELKSGRIRCHLEDVKRWWLWKPLPKELCEKPLIGFGGSLIDGERWTLRINEEDCWEWLAWKEAAGASTAQQDKPITSTTPLANQALKKKRKKRQSIHDWGAAIRFLEQEWKKNGDPHAHENRIKGEWESDSDIGWRIREHLEAIDPDNDPPEHRSVMRKIGPEIGRLRAANDRK